ncbi:MAG: class I SAM-dependent methyltransferase [candidate division WOR-3 bacterium]
MQYHPGEYWRERLGRGLDLRATGLLKGSASSNLYYYRLKEVVLSRTINKVGFNPTGKNVLDVGSGTGYWVNYFLSRGANVSGVDIVPEAVEALRVNFPEASFWVGDISHWQPSGEYELVNAFDVLYHITDDGDWARAVRGLWEALVSGGLLLFTDVFGLGEGTFSDSPHVRFRGWGLYEKILPSHSLVTVAPLYYLMGYPAATRGPEAWFLRRSFRYTQKNCQARFVGQELYASIIRY